MELIQVGLIADDIQDQKLSKYVAYKNDYSYKVPPVYSEDGETIEKEGYTKTGTALGAQGITFNNSSTYCMQKFNK